MKNKNGRKILLRAIGKVAEYEGNENFSIFGTSCFGFLYQPERPKKKKAKSK